MTTRRFNYTERQKILIEDARITLLTPEGGSTEFNAVLRLKEYGFPENAVVIIEAKRQASLMRYDFGTIGFIRAPEKCALEEFDPPTGVRFSVKVIDPTSGSGRLLGYAREIHPVILDTPEGSRDGILPVRKFNLGAEIWRLELTGGDDSPELLVNERIAGWKSLPKDPSFAAFVFPNIFRQILTAAIENGRPSADSHDWEKNWCAFAEALPGVDPVPEAKTEQSSWVERATGSFAKHQGYLERLLKREQEEQ